MSACARDTWRTIRVHVYIPHQCCFFYSSTQGSRVTGVLDNTVVSSCWQSCESLFAVEIAAVTVIGSDRHRQLQQDVVVGDFLAGRKFSVSLGCLLIESSYDAAKKSDSYLVSNSDKSKDHMLLDEHCA